MQGKMKWFTGAALAAVLAVSAVAITATAQSAPSGSPGGFCPGLGMMAGGVGWRGATPGFGPGVEHEAIAGALGITSQELWDARAAGKSVAELATEKGVELSKVVDAALTVHTARLDATVQAGTLTQTQADAMTGFMKSRIETQFQANGSFGAWGPGMMGGPGMTEGGFGPRGRGAP